MTDLMTDGIVFAYALWTIACHATVILEGNVRYGLTSASSVAAACFVLVVALLWKREDWRRAYFDDITRTPCFADVALSNGIRLAVLLAIPAVVITWIATHNGFLVWIEIIICYSIVAFFGLRMATLSASQVETSQNASRLPSILLVIASFICLAFTLFAFRPRSDEGFYSSMAISVVNYPDLVLSKYKTLHGLATEYLKEPLQYPPYRTHSFEILGGFLSYLSGVEPIKIVHLVIAPFFGWFAPFAIARLLRLLTPRYWMAALLIALSFYFIEGSADRGFSNQAFVRFFNGKSVMLTVAVPLLFLYGIRFASKPSLNRFILFACSQIMTVGLSSTGIWLAPVVATISVAAAIPTRRAVLRTMTLSLASSSYVILLGIWVAGQMHAGEKALNKIGSSGGSFNADFGLLGWVLPTVLGHGSTVIAHLSTVAFACVLARNAITWRLFAALGLVLSTVLANPFLQETVQYIVTGRFTYQRIFWILPVPVALGICCTGLFYLVRKKTRFWIAVSVVLVTLFTYYYVATERLVISRANHAKFVFPPAVKMWPRDREVALRVCKYASNDKYVLAPKPISNQLVSISKCAVPLMSEMRWMNQSRKEERWRNRMVASVGTRGIPLDQTAMFFEMLEKYKISVVVTTKKQYRNLWLHELLQQAGFRRVDSILGYRILLRESGGEPWALQRARNVARSTCRRVRGATTILAPFGISRHIEMLNGCPKPLISSQPEKDGLRISIDDRKRLDGLVSRKGDLRKKEIEWFTKTIEENEVGAVVMFSRADSNKRLKKALRKLDFVFQKIVDNCYILVHKSLLPVTSTESKKR